MLIERFFDAIDGLQKKIRETQTGKIRNAAAMIADSVEQGGAVHVYDTGHIIDMELINRAGGLMFLKQFKYVLNVENPVRARGRTGGIETSLEGLAEYALRASGALPGDVLIMGSVSGASFLPIDLAIESKKWGIKVIVLTSVEFSSSLESSHPSGKRLFELGDIIVDNCAPFGDAMLEVEGLEQRMSPASGISAAYIMWAIAADCADRLLEKGIVPSVYKSNNAPGGMEYNTALQGRYNTCGY